MKNIIIFSLILGSLLGCVSSENSIKEALNKNPRLVFDVIENNPEKFIEVVNSAARKAQELRYEQQLSQIRKEQENELKNPKQPVLSADRLLEGHKDAKLTIVEYADFQCPACGLAAQSLQEFKEKYKGKFKFYYKHIPLDFHKMAYPAALYFEAIRLQDITKAKSFYDLLFRNQQSMTDEIALMNFAKKLKVDTKRLSADVQSDKVKEVIEQDLAEAEKFGFTGTPVILINGVALHGAQNLEELERVAKLTGGLK